MMMKCDIRMMLIGLFDDMHPNTVFDVSLSLLFDQCTIRCGVHVQSVLFLMWPNTDTVKLTQVQ